MNLVIRKADIEDAAAIAHVHVESWRTTYAGIVSDVFLASLNKEVRTQSWQEQILTANISILVAEDETGIFGFAAGGRSGKNSTITMRSSTPSTCCVSDKNKVQAEHCASR